MEKLLIRGGRVMDPANGVDKTADVLIADGKIAAVGEHLSDEGAKVVLCAPPTLIPPRMDELGCTIAPTIEDACENADVVMGLRIQRERQQKGLFPSVAEYCDHWEITPQRLALAKKNALVMHPGPMNRGVEIASSVADCGQSVITQQVESGVAVRMALLYMLTRRENV